jgi:hypothetical protein
VNGVFDTANRRIPSNSQRFHEDFPGSVRARFPAALDLPRSHPAGDLRGRLFTRTP